MGVLSAAREEWAHGARCVGIDPELWFSSDTTATALRVCRECEVRLLCLEYALSLPDNPEGIWGGATSEQLRKLRARREVAA